MTILTMTYLLLQSSSYLSLWPYLLLVVVVLLLVAVLIQNRIVRHRVNESIASATSTYEMMEKALKTADNDVVIYDIAGKTIRRLRGNLLPTPEMRAEDFAPHIHPDDVDQFLATVRQVASGKMKSVEYSYRWRVRIFPRQFHPCQHYQRTRRRNRLSRTSAGRRGADQALPPDLRGLYRRTVILLS